MLVVAGSGDGQESLARPDTGGGNSDSNIIMVSRT